MGISYTTLASWACAPGRMVKRVLGLRPVRQPLSTCRRVLVIRPDEIGDVVLTSSFLRNLRYAAPQAMIVAVVSRTCLPLLNHCPHIDKCFALPFSPPSADGRSRRLYMRELLKCALRLKLTKMLRGFDLVLLPRVDADLYGAELTAHVLAGGGAVLMNSAGFIRRDSAPPPDPRLSDFRHISHTPQSEPQANLEFLEWCGASTGADFLEFWNSAEDDAMVEAWLTANAPHRRHMVFHPPGSRSTLRRWPVGRCREFIQRVLAATDYTVVVVGGRHDEWVLEELKCFEKEPRVRIALHEFTLPQLGALIKLCGYFVGGDSGPMHISAAVGAKTLGIFGPGSEIRFQPYGRNAVVVSLRYHCSPDLRRTWQAGCQSCGYTENRCLTEISADRVVQQFLRMAGPSHLNCNESR